MRVDQKHPDQQGIDGSALPRPNRRLTALARSLARRAEPVLPTQLGMLLAVTRTEGGEILLTWWDREFRVVAQICAASDDFHPASSGEGALQRAGNALLRYFAGRWPEGSAPANMGVITDGVGVGFAPDDPAPTAPGWLMRHATGKATLRTILPMAPTGPAALLLPAAHSGQLH